MVIKANNFVVGKQKKEEPVIPAPPPPVKKAVEKPKVEEAPLDITHHTHDTQEHGVLIVDGKEKKVSKHSHYLLDMLSIEDSE